MPNMSKKQIDAFSLIKQKGYAFRTEIDGRTSRALIKAGLIKFGPVYDQDTQAYLGVGLKLVGDL